MSRRASVPPEPVDPPTIPDVAVVEVDAGVKAEDKVIADDLAQVVLATAAEVKDVADKKAEGLAVLVKDTAVEAKDTAAALAQVVLDTATEVKATADKNAADLAALVKETANLLKKTTEDTAAVVRTSAESNAQFAPLLIQSLDVISVAVTELSANSVALRGQAEQEVVLLRSRTKYFVGVIVASVLVTAMTAANLWLNIAQFVK